MAYRRNLIALSLVLVVIALIMLRKLEPSAESPTARVTPSNTTTAPEQASLPQLPVGSQDELPNLVITDIYYDEPYIRVDYVNSGGSRVSADFIKSWSSPQKSFGGNTFYRSQVPPPGEERSSGGLTIGLIKGEKGKPISVTVEIDPENRVAESDELDNAKMVTLTPGVPGSNRDRLESVPVSYDPDLNQRGLDIIVTDSQLDEQGQLNITYANQGFESASQTLAIEIGKGRGRVQKFDGLPIPAPAQSLEYKTTNLDVEFERTDIVKIVLDPEGLLPGERDGNNTFFRQLDNSHNLNGRSVK